MNDLLNMYLSEHVEMYNKSKALQYYESMSCRKLLALTYLAFHRETRTFACNILTKNGRH
jgi:hypothetical protein